jgi:HD-like signal output (HDOD) protein
VTRILFVDDEQRILAGIKRVLYARRHEWHVELVSDPLRAVELLAGERFDVVVSDMRMPGMSGAEFLEVVKQRMPTATRVVLSGQCERESTAQSISVAHQFLSKPCSAQALIDTLSRAVDTSSLLGSDELRRIVGGIARLPSPPSIHRRLSEALLDPDVELDVLEAILRQDIALCAKLLQLVNSSFFGLGQVISDVRHAAAYLGAVTLRRVVLSAEVFSKFDASEFPVDFDLGGQQLHALQVAELASAIVPQPEAKEVAFTAGMLHDVGELVLATQLPAEFARTCAARRAGMADPDTERLHARVGAYLIGQWGLPMPVVQAVAHHHDRRPAERRELELVDALALADQLVQAAAAKHDADRRRILATIDRDALAALGVANRLEAWTDLARGIVSRAA